MDAHILDKEKIPTLIDKLSEKYEVYGPGEERFTLLSCENTEGSKTEKPAVDLNERGKVPPKSIFFPQTEEILRFDGDIEVEEEGKEIAVLGIRPCDAQSFAMLDEVFGEEYDDPYYQKKRRDSLLVGLGCNSPDRNCFCSSVEGGPFSSEGLDILMTDLGEHFYLEGVSKEGEKFLEENDDIFEKPAQEDEEKRKEIENEAQEKIERKIDVEKVHEQLQGLFENGYWKEKARKCMGCGVCTFLCPTCHCFDMQDETYGEEGARVRIWDSCMYPEYTVQASGYNPRAGRMNRLRNRVYHKYDYMKKNFDIIGCVGCGRCIEHCPTNMDLIEVLNGLEEVN